MKICFIVDNEKIFHPNFVYNTYSLLKKKYEIELTIGLVTKIPNNSNINKYFISKILKFKIRELFKLFFIFSKVNILNLFFPRGFNKKYYSINSLAKDNKLKIFEISSSINDKKYIEKIKNFNFDLIISSNSLYFCKEILSLPKYGCINRHSSLLPKYAGLLPVFHAISRNENEIGISVHLMNDKIDGGPIISQISILNNKNLFSLYKLIFEKSSYLVFNALEKVINQKINLHTNSVSKLDYFSMPNENDWKNFRANKGAII